MVLLEEKESSANSPDSEFVPRLASEDDDIDDVADEIKGVFSKLCELWNELGYDISESKASKLEYFDAILETAKIFFDKEVELKTKTIKSIETFQNRIEKLCNGLEIPEPEVQHGSGLHEYESNLNEICKTLEQMNATRNEQYDNLRRTETELCCILGIEMKPMPESKILSKDYLNEYEHYISELNSTAESRVEKFQLLKKNIIRLMCETEFLPPSKAENDILWGDEIQSLSENNLQILESLQSLGETRKQELASERETLLNKLMLLWKRLNIEQDKQEEFLSEHADSHPLTLKAITEEIESYEQIKKENLGKFIETLKLELIMLWDKCHVSETHRRAFQPFSALEATDEVLQAIETETEKWKEYFDQTRCIYQKLEQWDNLFKILAELEEKATDPNRFKNRKGCLLKDEKERKKIQRDLPCLENEISKEIAAIEQKLKMPFFYKGEKFLDYIEHQNETKKKQNENFQSPKVNTPAKRNQTPKASRTLRSSSISNTPTHTPDKTASNSLLVKQNKEITEVQRKARNKD